MLSGFQFMTSSYQYSSLKLSSYPVPIQVAAQMVVYFSEVKKQMVICLALSCPLLLVLSVHLKTCYICTKTRFINVHYHTVKHNSESQAAQYLHYSVKAMSHQIEWALKHCSFRCLVRLRHNHMWL